MVNGDSQLREFGRFRLDTRKRVLWFDDQPVNIPLKEIELLCVLTDHSGQVITKDEILEKVWADSYVEESNLTRHIYLLRKIFRECGEKEDLIQTVPRRGYRFTGKLREAANEDLVIERHTRSQTLIEFPGEDALQQEAGPFTLPEPKKSGIGRLAIGFAAVAALLIGAFLYWNYFRTPQTAASPTVRSIAVLPVRSFSGASDDDELRIRITDALITRLGNLDRIAVRPTSAVMPFTNTEEDGLSIGRKLKVDAIVDSRIQQEGERLRVTIQLVRVADGEHLWAGQFDGLADRILDLQDTISSKVSQTFYEAATAGDVFAKRPTENAEAYEAYLKGRFFWNRRDEDSLRKAVEYFSRAATLDPGFSEAFSGLADTQHLLFNYNIDVRPEVVEEAKSNLRRALELKPDSPDALITLGTIEMGYDWNWAGAEQTLKHAVNVGPNSATAHMRYGALLVRIRRFDEAIDEFERHIELDPLSINGSTNLGLTFFCKKDFAAAERQYFKTLELDEKNGASRWLLSRNYWLQGRKEDSVREIVRALELDKNPPLAEKVRTKFEGSGPNAAIELLLYEWRMNPPGTNPHNLAYLSTYLGDTEKAIQWLRRSIEEHHPWTSWIAAAPEFEVLRSDQRYIEMLRQVGLP